MKDVDYPKIIQLIVKLEDSHITDSFLNHLTD